MGLKSWLKGTTSLHPNSIIQEGHGWGYPGYLGLAQGVA